MRISYGVHYSIKMSRITHTLKFTLCSFNILFVLLGLATIGIGMAYQLKWTVAKDETKPYLIVAPWVFILIGAIMLVIAFFGYFGAIWESHSMVVTYAIFLLVIIIVQVVIAVLLLTYEDTIKQDLMRSLKTAFDKRSSTKAAKAKVTVINNIQEQFACCGYISPQYYGFMCKFGVISLPDSCCYGNLIGSNCTVEAAHPGCEGKISDFYDKWDKPIAGAVIGVACTEGAMFALFLTNSKRNMDRRFSY